MKARVKATGEIVELSNCSTIVDTKQRLFKASELEDISDKTDKVLLDELDEVYWANMKHQYAGMAMQGMIRRAYEAYCDDCANYENMIFEDAQALLKDHAEALADVCVEYSHALVRKLKEKEERK